jgi:hypothetical protein
MELCYFCGKNATSKEHVPPKCIFPKLKDSLDGKNYRENLITVPSCDRHNSDKSNDDIYLLYVLALNILSNQHGSHQAKTAVIKDILHNDSLLKRISSNITEVTVEDVDEGNFNKTGAFKIEDERLNSALEHISKGLFFYHFQKIFDGEIKIISEFIITLPSTHFESDLSINLNNDRELIRKIMDVSLEKEPFYGSNKDIFKYKYVWNENMGCIMRLFFYGDNKVSVIFNGKI